MKTESRQMLSSLIVLAMPLVLQNIISVSVGFADNLMVGSLGEYAVAGIMLANQVQLVMMFLIFGMASTVVLLASQYWGKKDMESIKSIISIALKGAVFVGLLLSAVALLFPYQVLGIFSDNEPVISEGVTYLRIIAFSYVFFCITQVLMASMRCVEVVRIALVVAISTLIIAIGLNYLLIFGNFGFPALGIRGAAIATLSARVVESVIMIIYVRFIDTRLKLRIKDLRGFNKILLGDFLRNGTPIITGDVLWGLANTVQVAIIGRLGSEAMASQSVTLILYQFVTVVVWGFSGASAVVMGKTVGAGEYDLVKQYARMLQVVFAILGVTASATFFGVRDFVISQYNFTPETVTMARQFMAVAAIHCMFSAYHASCFIGIIRAGGDVKFVLKVDLICAWFIVIPSALVAAFVFQLPPPVVFFFLRIDQFFKWIIAIIKTNNFSWIMNLTRDKAGGELVHEADSST